MSFRSTTFGSHGFTLLELLVAISVFSVIGLGAYQMLQTIIDSHDRVRSTSDGYVSLNLAFSIIQRDFNQYTSRSIRDLYGEPLPPMVFDNEEMVVEFTRAGWSNPAGRTRSSLQRVAYSVDYDKGELTRHFWKVLDRAEDSEPVSRVILTAVEDFRVTGFQTEDEEDVFSLDDETPVAPRAVEVTIAIESLGELTRLFQLVETPPNQVANSGNAGNDSGTGADGEDTTNDNSSSDDADDE